MTRTYLLRGAEDLAGQRASEREKQPPARSPRHIARWIYKSRGSRPGIAVWHLRVAVTRRAYKTPSRGCKHVSARCVRAIGASGTERPRCASARLNFCRCTRRGLPSSHSMPVTHAATRNSSVKAMERLKARLTAAFRCVWTTLGAFSLALCFSEEQRVRTTAAAAAAERERGGSDAS